MGRSYYSEKAERKADKICEKFAHSNNVMQDMVRAYHTDFSNIRIHTDDAARALVGDEFAHIMQKGPSATK